MTNSTTTNNVEVTTPSVHEELYAVPSGTSRRIICIAVDGSEHAKRAFEWAMSNLVHTPSDDTNVKDQVILLNCRKYYATSPFKSLDAMGELSLESSMQNSSWFDNLEEVAKQESHDLLKKFGAVVLDANVPCRAIALRGDPREEILAKANEVGADVIVCGTRGMSALKRAMLGSLSTHLIHHAHCTVTVVKPNAV
ncbi:hypothetical protein BC829DRAFT_486917 [Chytridium lagenaria]|nr:hypothetical protein BC829DRAFT_486917 [Chytridium lagenaria]